MPWALLDVGFHDHPKVLALMDEPDALAAIGLWTLTLAWAKGHCDPDNPAAAGRIPPSLVRRLGGDAHLGSLLVKTGLWIEDDAGWIIHEFASWQQLEAWRVKRETGRKGGRPRRSEPSGNHVVKQNETISQSHDMTGHDMSLQKSEADASDSSSDAKASDGGGKLRPVVDQPGQRDDVERLCQHLADRIEQQTGARPNVIKQWRTAARLLLDLDKRTEGQVHSAIDWCQDDEFWRSNILSMPKLRSKYIQLRAAAQRSGANGTPVATSDQRAMMALDAGRRVQARREAAERKELEA